MCFILDPIANDETKFYLNGVVNEKYSVFLLGRLRHLQRL